MRAGDKPKVDGTLVGIREFERCGFDRVDVPDEVCHAHIGRGKFLYVAVFASEPSNGRRIALFGNHILSVARERSKRIIIQFRSLHHGHVLIEQAGELPGNTGFGLTAKAEQ